MTQELQKTHNEAQGRVDVSSTRLLGDLVKTWRNAAKEWRNHPAKASETRYEDGLAEAFDRCADMLDNRLCVGPTNRSQSWWCETCKTYVSGRDVTYDETHDIRAGGCGDKVA